MSIEFTLNEAATAFEGDPDMLLLWYLRDHAQLTGTKFGCGIGACGACTVHLDGRAQRSCVTPMRAIDGRRVRTIEALATAGKLHPVQQAWIEEDVAQCGYCQVGQIMSAVDLLSRSPTPTEVEVDAITNLCRCGTYPRIRRAIARAVVLTRAEAKA